MTFHPLSVTLHLLANHTTILTFVCPMQIDWILMRCELKKIQSSRHSQTRQYLPCSILATESYYENRPNTSTGELLLSCQV